MTAPDPDPGATYIADPTYLDEAGKPRQAMRLARAILRLLLVLLLAGICVPLHALFMVVYVPAARAVRRFFYRITSRIVGLRIDVSGAPDKTAMLFAGNHSSYLDILALGGMIDGDFIAKGDIDGWPVIGALARSAETMFVSRSRSRTGDESALIHQRMINGRAHILFPEGTATDNLSVQPFKSSFFAMAQTGADGIAVRVQPFVLTYVTVGGQDVDIRAEGLRGGARLLPVLTWHDDMPFGAHIWRFLHTSRTVVQLDFLPAVTMDEAGGNRKSLCQHIENGVRDCFTRRR